VCVTHVVCVSVAIDCSCEHTQIHDIYTGSTTAVRSACDANADYTDIDIDTDTDTDIVTDTHTKYRREV